jgi:hypothetical protein
LSRPSLPAVFALVASTALASRAEAWGPEAHRHVAAEAIDTLPKGLKPFYKAHKLEIPSLSLEGTLPDEGTDRRFSVDRLVPFPFTDLPATEDALKARFGEDAGKAGRLPWLVQESYTRLVDAFKSGDKVKILTESDTLAGLVADLHNPLALTDNADGQKTGQHGLWVRFGTKLPEATEDKLKLSPEAARFLDKPQDYVFSMIKGSYIWLDNLLYQEEIAHRGQSGYGEIYYDALLGRAGHILRERLSQAASDAGSYWYTAWTVAGRPELK